MIRMPETAIVPVLLDIRELRPLDHSGIVVEVVNKDELSAINFLKPNSSAFEAVWSGLLA